MVVEADQDSQAYSGIYHFLPLGRRIVEKSQAIIDRHLEGLGCAQLSLSSISSEDVWSRSGRLNSSKSELFRFPDKAGSKMLLSPTHEEEITSIVAGAIKSYKELPLRLYQTTRKYRDELRPRHGLLRSREFLMTDLYTFDYSARLALDAYEKARQTFEAIFSELRIPFLVAEADSGNIGGDLSHEFHFTTPRGEDQLVKCDRCDYVANIEVATGQNAHRPALSENKSDNSLHPPPITPLVWRALSKDRTSLINVYYLARDVSTDDHPRSLNMHTLRKVYPNLDVTIQDLARFYRHNSTTAVDRPRPSRVVNIFDCRLTEDQRQLCALDHGPLRVWPEDLIGQTSSAIPVTQITSHVDGSPLDILLAKAGDACPRCHHGAVSVESAIEIGHTFHLGTRYSEPLHAYVNVPERFPFMSSAKELVHPIAHAKVPMQMGCHGIGVSRMIGAVADILADERGLNWPRAIAPFEVVLVAGQDELDAACHIYDSLSARNTSEAEPLDIVIDDRSNLALAWKMKDADLLGYPVMVVLGKHWRTAGLCEVQCRRLGIVEHVAETELRSLISSLLAQL